MNQNAKKCYFTIDFIEKTIAGTKASLKKAGKGSGAEYEELTAKMATHPDFKLVVVEPKHKSNKAKTTYKGLDYTFMEAYISTLKNAEAVLTDYNAVKEMARTCGTKAYPLTKKWFLTKFSTEEKPFDMDKARDAISNYRIDKAITPAA